MARYTIDFSTNASAVVREIERVNREITNVARNGKKVTINLDTSGLKTQISATFAQLNREIASMQAKLSKLQIGSQPFRKTAAAMGFREGQVERGQMIAQPLRLRGQAQSFEQDSLVRLQKELQAAQIEASQIRPATEPWVRLQGEIARINGELRQADKLAENIQLTRDLGAFSPGSLNQLEAKLTILRNRAREISPDTTEWKNLNKEIVKAEQGIERQTKKPLSRGQRLGAAGGAFLYGGGLGGGVGSAVGGIAGGLLGGVPGAFTGAAIGQAVDTLGQYAAAVAKIVGEVNKARVALAGVTRDQQDYETALAAATDASNKFLLPISDATRQFARLQASVAGAGFQTDTTKKVFDGIAAAIVATGGKTEDLNGALLATAQVFSKGKVSAEELRGQIGERLPGAFTVFASAVGKTPQQLDDALQKGEVTLSDFVLFTEELTKRYGKTAEILATAPENAGARLQVALQDASVRYAGFFQVVGAGFQDSLTGVLNWARQNEDSIKRVVTVFAIGFNTLGGLIGKFTKFLVDSFNGAFAQLLGNLDTVLARIEDAINRAVGAASLTPAQIQKFQEQADKATKAKYGARIDLGGRNGPINTGLILDQNAASQYYNKYFNDLVDTATKSRGAKKYTEEVQKKLFPDFKPSSFGSGLGQNPGGIPGAGGGGAGGKTARERQLRDFQNERIAELKTNEKIAQQRLDQQRQLEIIDETEYAIASASNKRKFELLVIEEALAQKRASIGEFEANVREKQLGVFEQLAENERTLVEEEYKTAVQGAKLQLSRPFKDAIRDENIEIGKQTLLLENLQKGFAELTPEQEANLIIEEKIKDLRTKQQALIQAEIDNLRTVTLERIRGANALQRETELLRLRNQAAVLRAPLGQERLVELQQNPNLTPEQAKAQFALEEQNRRLQVLREGAASLAGTINSTLGDSIVNLATNFGNAQQIGLNFLQTLADGFKQLANTIIQELTRAFVNQAVSKIFGFALSFVPGLGSFSGGAGFGQQTQLPSGVGIGAGNGIIQNPGGQGFGTLGPNFGFRQFAQGGVVTGPTLGLVGEGRFNEAVVPLPDGRRIPVDLGGNTGNNISTNIVVNVNNGQASSQVNGSNGQAFGRELEGAVRSVILKESRPGGIIYSQR
jgi:tape measure domain-containing protein